MDILISSNLERLLYYMSNQDTEFVKQCMDDLNQKGRYQIPAQMLEKYNLYLAVVILMMKPQNKS